MMTQPVVAPFVEVDPNDRRILGSDDFAGKLLGAAWRPRSRKNAHRPDRRSLPAVSPSLPTRCARPSLNVASPKPAPGSLIKRSPCASPPSPKSPVPSIEPKAPCGKASSCTSSIRDYRKPSNLRRHPGLRALNISHTKYSHRADQNQNTNALGSWSTRENPLRILEAPPFR